MSSSKVSGSAPNDDDESKDESENDDEGESNNESEPENDEKSKDKESENSYERAKDSAASGSEDEGKEALSSEAATEATAASDKSATDSVESGSVEATTKSEEGSSVPGSTEASTAATSATAGSSEKGSKKSGSTKGSSKKSEKSKKTTASKRGSKRKDERKEKASKEKAAHHGKETASKAQKKPGEPSKVGASKGPAAGEGAGAAAGAGTGAVAGAGVVAAGGGMAVAGAGVAAVGSKKDSHAIDIPEEGAKDSGENANWFNIKNRTNVRIFLAEFLASILFVYISIGSRAQVIIGRHLSEHAINQRGMDSKTYDYMMFGDFVAIAFGYGIAYTIAMVISFNVSGGHLNPALTFAMVIWRNITWGSLPAYCIGQYFGSLIGVVLVYSIHISAIRVFDPVPPYFTSNIFTSYPTYQFYKMFPLIWDQFIGSAYFALGYFALTDRRNQLSTRTQALIPLFAGLLLVAISLSTGIVAGTAINPARDGMSRLFMLMSGYGEAVLTDGDGYFWIPLIVPYFGALVGATIYRMCISWYLHDAHEMQKPAASIPKMIQEDKIKMQAPGELGITRGTQVELEQLRKREPILPQKRVSVVEYQRQPNYDEIARYILEILRNTTIYQKPEHGVQIDDKAKSKGSAVSTTSRGTGQYEGSTKLGGMKSTTRGSRSTRRRSRSRGRKDKHSRSRGRRDRRSRSRGGRDRRSRSRGGRYRDSRSRRTSDRRTSSDDYEDYDDEYPDPYEYEEDGGYEEDYGMDEGDEGDFDNFDEDVDNYEDGEDFDDELNDDFDLEDDMGEEEFEDDMNEEEQEEQEEEEG